MAWLKCVWEETRIPCRVGSLLEASGRLWSEGALTGGLWVYGGPPPEIMGLQGTVVGDKIVDSSIYDYGI